jgi:impB/mucB/samB family
MEPLTLSSFDRAIVHIDGDAFFASCEQSRRPKLQGRPLVTGKERGIAASMSYEAKARGVTRGMRIADIRKVCPEAVILPSDYETYSLLSKRFFAIVRRYTPDVEEYPPWKPCCCISRYIASFKCSHSSSFWLLRYLFNNSKRSSLFICQKWHQLHLLNLSLG